VAVIVLMFGIGFATLGGTAASSGVAQASVDLGWVRVPPGTFLMGCVDADTACLDNERPRHEITFVVPFELMAAEVTARQYARFVRDTRHRPPPEPDYRQSAQHPVVLVSWDDAVSFCAWAGGRLPTEAEWEYAARGDRPGLVYGWGDELSRDVVNYGADQCCAGATGGADEWLNTAPVRSFPPNDFGLYDMAGNVWEWVDGWLDDDYYASSPSINPPGAATGYARIARGGSWLNFPGALRTSVRLPFAQTGQTSNIGVRCARDVPAAVAQ
jgi:formylglycine-generating enzyme required for sulfatase activity